MALVLVMLLVALIALFIAVTVVQVIAQRRPRATEGGVGDARICRLAMRSAIVEAAEGYG